DWSESWIWVLLLFHFFCLAITVITVLMQQQIVQFVLFLFAVYMSENLNKWAAINFRVFSKHQYFDKNGMFVSMVFSFPLLFLSCCIVVSY
ncbi:hypothetical protein HELRODRAFT_136896, partial [Helobdella robusta]|uniref:Uncharacterized protein n=1 Tax=Helobdella robusta TaxID=6412 RepID=T1EIG4_HELRO